MALAHFVHTTWDGLSLPKPFYISVSIGTNKNTLLESQEMNKFDDMIHLLHCPLGSLGCWDGPWG